MKQTTRYCGLCGDVITQENLGQMHSCGHIACNKHGDACPICPQQENQNVSAEEKA